MPVLLCVDGSTDDICMECRRPVRRLRRRAWAISVLQQVSVHVDVMHIPCWRARRPGASTGLRFFAQFCLQMLQDKVFCYRFSASTGRRWAHRWVCRRPLRDRPGSKMRATVPRSRFWGVLHVRRRAVDAPVDVTSTARRWVPCWIEFFFLDPLFHSIFDPYP